MENYNEENYQVSSIYEYEIFPRLPFHSLQCCKCVSKTWLYYLNTPYFIDSHLTRSIQDHHLNLSLFDPSNKAIKTVDINTLLPCTGLYEFRVKESPSIAGSCNGLLCFKSDEGENYNFLVYNPATQVENHYRVPFVGDIDGQIQGFGFTCVDKDYRFVFIQTQQIHIYNLKSFWCKSIGDNSCKGDVLRAQGVSTGGVIHWLYGSQSCNKGILSIDLATERQFKTTLPNHSKKPWLMPLNGRLHVAFNKYIYSDEFSVELDIWVMKEYGDNIHECWVRLFIVELDDIKYSAIPIALKEGGRHVLLQLWRHQDQEHQKSYAWYDLVTKACGCELVDVQPNLIAMPCFESLVEP